MKPTIICFGEVLWDVLPTGKLAGGAPMNVAYHTNALGLKAAIVSRVGGDDLGAELSKFLIEKGISTALLQEDPAHKTGVVQVTLDAQGSPSYEIEMPVAWDYIEPAEKARQATEAADLFVYGSLASRSEVSKNTLFELLAIARKKVFDVNLRDPFYDKALIESLLKQADIAKMNEQELDIISSWYGRFPTLREKASALQNYFDIETLVVSHGSVGAYCLEAGVLHFQPSFKITVTDTIGSGDAFLAGFLAEKTKGKHPQECLITACKAGAYVATQKGATPPMSRELLSF